MPPGRSKFRIPEIRSWGSETRYFRLMSQLATFARVRNRVAINWRYGGRGLIRAGYADHRLMSLMCQGDATYIAAKMRESQNFAGSDYTRMQWEVGSGAHFPEFHRRVPHLCCWCFLGVLEYWNSGNFGSTEIDNYCRRAAPSVILRGVLLALGLQRCPHLTQINKLGGYLTNYEIN